MALGLLAARTPLILLLAGTAGHLVVDTVFLTFSVRDAGPDAHVPTLLHLPMFLILLAPVVQPRPAGAGTDAVRSLRRNAWLPYAALAGGYLLLVVAAARSGLFPWLGLIVGAFVMTLGVARGVRVALDDFGTGYSSLQRLTRLPVDILKLDRCFVAELNGDPERAAVAEAVIRLSQILRMETVAEGIEDGDQATELTLLRYRNAQGYHFARPLPPDGVERLLFGAGLTPARSTSVS
ncbi:EAL domain-containing protein [Dactylosporangium sp. NPDC000244]|uniref:EAL domain-containing protein n=1 Tax=Dactylosporangium sp. NPDC000244 TaxID=3154365 RepID=UPI00333117D9